MCKHKVGNISKNPTVEVAIQCDRDWKIPIIVAIIGIAGLFIAGYINYLDWQNHIAFDKRGAASQLSIEIDSMNKSLQDYAYQYMNYYDFSKDGKDVIINTNVNSLLRVFDESKTRLYEISVKNGAFIAKKINGYPVRNNGTLKIRYPILTIVSEGRIEINQFPVVVDNPIIPGPLYNEHGIYYTYVTDVSKFNKNLSQDLYIFYNYITRAESDRQYIQNYLDSHPNDKLNGPHFDTYMDMRIGIISAAKMAPLILRELNAEENI